MAGLEDLYREIILDHYRSPRNRGELPVPPAHKVEGFNPLCGDKATVFLRIEDGIVKDISFTGKGCSIATASSSMMTEALKGKSLEAGMIVLTGSIIPTKFVTASSEVRLEEPSALELAHTRAHEFGVGVRVGVRYGGQAFAASVEYSLMESNDQTLDRNWISASVSYRF